MLGAHLKLERVPVDELLDSFVNAAAVKRVGQLQGISLKAGEQGSEIGIELQRSYIYPGPTTCFVQVRCESSSELQPSGALAEAAQSANRALAGLGIEASFVERA